MLLPPTKEEVNAIVGICLSVYLLARLHKNVCMDLDEILPVDRCRDMDVEPDPDHSLDAGTGFLSQISYTLQNFAALPCLAYFSANLAYFSAISVSRR